MFKLFKLFAVFTSVIQAPTSVIALADSVTESDYKITSEMVKHLNYHNFTDWSTVPWNSAYFDISQPDLKLVSASVVGDSPDVLYSLQLHSTVVGTFDRYIYKGKGVYSFNQQDLDQLSLILFNHNYVSDKHYNEFVVWNAGTPPNFAFTLNFEINKPLSFYIQSFMFYFNFLNFNNFTADYTFSFLDFNGDTRYKFLGVVDNYTYKRDIYNFITMPVRVPNLKHLTVEFFVYGNPISFGTHVKFGQTNIFSAQEINPVPPDNPFNPDYERVSWYDLFGHLRNALRWCIYGVVGKVLPVDLLRQFLLNVDSLLRSIFNDTISSVLMIDFVSGIEQLITLWIFIKSATFLIG